MDRNSPKPAETGNPQITALHLGLQWLDREGGQQRSARALREVMEQTLTAVSRGERPPETDTNTLREILQKLEGDPLGASKSVRAADLRNWWGAREEQVRQLCAREGCSLTPRLVAKQGGGRGLPSRLSFEFYSTIGVEPEVEEDEAAASAGRSCVVRYEMGPVKPALWLRLLVGSKPFPIQSWRGYVLLGTAAFNMALIGFIWLAMYASWTRGHSITTATIAQVAFAVLVTLGLWWLSAPMRKLPTQRVALAGPSFLAWSELYGQLRTMPAVGRKLKSREFSIVRHWGICPICSAEIDLDSGRAAFRDRLVGRCHDAPFEHVFSFDPVRLVGRPLLGEDAGITGRQDE